mmetsp:Transcript_12155/g.37250  ORF Transcript_12155/g.37250 Transcript_12155/m.37250 type:complete len:186 (-) Transcript_12155:1838-2395(-)
MRMHCCHARAACACCGLPLPWDITCPQNQQILTRSMRLRMVCKRSNCKSEKIVDCNSRLTLLLSPRRWILVEDETQGAHVRALLFKWGVNGVDGVQALGCGWSVARATILLALGPLARGSNMSNVKPLHLTIAANVCLVELRRFTGPPTHWAETREPSLQQLYTPRGDHQNPGAEKDEGKEEHND